jgi:hypothetical protein
VARFALNGQDAPRDAGTAEVKSMQRRRWWIASLCAGLALAVASPLRAAPAVSAADAKAVRGVIEAQLAAFAADDASKAFSYAAPGIRAMFGSAERFLAMVREGYPVVYRPASVSFLGPEWIDDKLIQRVQMTDGAGAPWMVVYELERQADRSWRIAACVAARGSGRAT